MATLHTLQNDFEGHTMDVILVYVYLTFNNTLWNLLETTGAILNRNQDKRLNFYVTNALETIESTTKCLHIL